MLVASIGKLLLLFWTVDDDGTCSNVEKTGKTLPVVRNAVRIRVDETPITGGKLVDGETQTRKSEVWDCMSKTLYRLSMLVGNENSLVHPNARFDEKGTEPCSFIVVCYAER